MWILQPQMCMAVFGGAIKTFDLYVDVYKF